MADSKSPLTFLLSFQSWYFSMNIAGVFVIVYNMASLSRIRSILASSSFFFTQWWLRHLMEPITSHWNLRRTYTFPLFLESCLMKSAALPKAAGEYFSTCVSPQKDFIVKKSSVTVNLKFTVGNYFLVVCYPLIFLICILFIQCLTLIWWKVLTKWKSWILDVDHMLTTRFNRWNTRRPWQNWRYPRQ